MIIKQDDIYYLIVDRTIEYYYAYRLTKSKRKIDNRYKNKLYKFHRKEDHLEIIESGGHNIER